MTQILITTGLKGTRRQDKFTIIEYFELLADSFILSIVYFFDHSIKEMKPTKQKKVYPIDPIISEVILDLSNKRIELPQLIEAITLRHLMSEHAIAETALNLVRGPYFWYSDKGKEIDFIVEVNDKITPVQGKYQNKVNRSDYLTMKRVFNKGIVVTKDILGKDEEILLIPAWLFFAIPL